MAGHSCHIFRVTLLGVETILDSHLLIELVLVIGMTLGNTLAQVFLGDDFGWSGDDHVWVAFFPAFVVEGGLLLLLLALVLDHLGL